MNHSFHQQLAVRNELHPTAMDLENAQVDETMKMAKERVDLAKALVRASEKPSKPSKRRSKDGDADKASGDKTGKATAESATA